jgi:hypothetical protein
LKTTNWWTIHFLTFEDDAARIVLNSPASLIPSSTPETALRFTCTSASHAASAFGTKAKDYTRDFTDRHAPHPKPLQELLAVKVREAGADILEEEHFLDCQVKDVFWARCGT